MKRLLFFTVVFVAPLGATPDATMGDVVMQDVPMEDVLQQQQQPQAQEEKVTVDFGDKSSQKVERNYVLLSSVLRNQLEDTDGDIVLVPHKSEFKVLGAYLPKLYQLQQARSDQDRERIRNELAALLTRKQPKELVVTNEQLGMIANMAHYLEIEVMPEIALEICFDRLLSDIEIKNQFLTSTNPEAFNPFGLNDTLLVSLKEKLLQSYVPDVPGHTLSYQSGVRINVVAWSPDGTTLASGSSDGNITLFKLQQGKWVNVQTLMEREGEVLSLAWRPNGTAFASASDQGTITLWQLEDNTWVNKYMHKSHSAILSLAWSMNGVLGSKGWDDYGALASGSRDGIITWWIARHDKLTELFRSQLNDPIESLAWNRHTLASGSRGVITLWALNKVNLAVNRFGEWVAKYTFGKTLNLGKRSFNSVAWSPWILRSPVILASGSQDGIIRLWQEQAGTWVNVHTLTGGHTDSVNSVAWNPHGMTLASGSQDGTIKLWQQQANQWMNVYTLKGHRDSVNSVAWNPHGMTLAAGSADGTITIWNIIAVSLQQQLPTFQKDMSFAQVLLAFYALQALENNQRQLNLAKYPKLLELYESIKTLSDKPEFQKIIAKLFEGS